MLKRAYLVASGAFALGCSTLATGALLGLSVDFPFLFYSTTQENATEYDAVSDLFTVTSSPVLIFTGPTDPPAFVNAATCPGFSGEVLSMNFIVNEFGILSGGVPGNDLELVGEVDLGGLGTFCGVLLTAEISAFGFLNVDNANPGTDEYDMIFTCTGGMLADLVFGGQDIGVTLTSENSSFTDSFTVPFRGQAKGNLFPILFDTPGLDIKPTSCPSSWNPNSNGNMPVALTGTDGFDVSEVDLSTVRLTRADGVGGEAVPHEGPPGPHTVIDDVATPFPGDLCDCHTLGGDGIDDLVMKFRSDGLVGELMLDQLPAGSYIELIVSGLLNDGTPFEARDCMRIPGGSSGSPQPATIDLIVEGANESYVLWNPMDLRLEDDSYVGTYSLDTEDGVSHTFFAPFAQQNGMIIRGWRLLQGGDPNGPDPDWLFLSTGDTVQITGNTNFVTTLRATFIPLASPAPAGGPISGPIGGLR